MEQHVVPGIYGPWQAPVHAVVVHGEVLLRRPPPELARVRVRPRHHRLRGVHQQHPHGGGAGGPLKLLHLQLVEVELDALYPLLAAPGRPRPEAVAVLVPLPVLVLRRRHGALHGRAAEPAVEADQGPERGA
jgi:hypothetical protein